MTRQPKTLSPIKKEARARRIAAAQYGKLVWHTRIADMPISLHQRSRRRDTFTVVYWKQVKTDLNYGEACAELGMAMLHALACDGKLDNGELK